MAQLRQSSKHFACKLAGRTLTDRRQAHQWCPSSTSHRSPKARPSSVTSGSRFVGDGTGVWWLRKSKRVNRPAGKRSQSPSRQPLPHPVTNSPDGQHSSMEIACCFSSTTEMLTAVVLAPSPAHADPWMIQQEGLEQYLESSSPPPPPPSCSQCLPVMTCSTTRWDPRHPDTCRIAQYNTHVIVQQLRLPLTTDPAKARHRPSTPNGAPRSVSHTARHHLLIYTQIARQRHSCRIMVKPAG